MMELETLHSCKKSKNKIVMISSDGLGNTFCGYCHEKVDYSNWTMKKMIELEEKMNIGNTISNKNKAQNTL